MSDWVSNACFIKNVRELWDHSFSTCAEFSVKLNFYTLWYAHKKSKNQRKLPSYKSHQELHFYNERQELPASKTLGE